MAVFDLFGHFAHGPSFAFFGPFVQDRPFFVGTGRGVEYVAAGAFARVLPKGRLVFVGKLFTQTDVMQSVPATFEAHEFGKRNVLGQFLGAFETEQIGGVDWNG